MAPLNRFFIDEAIQNLRQVAGTSNAHTTYKTSGWKASFSKYKNASVKEQIIKDQKFRDEMERQLPKKLREQVSHVKLGKTMTGGLSGSE